MSFNTRFVRPSAKGDEPKVEWFQSNNTRTLFAPNERQMQMYGLLPVSTLQHLLDRGFKMFSLRSQTV